VRSERLLVSYLRDLSYYRILVRGAARGTAPDSSGTRAGRRVTAFTLALRVGYTPSPAAITPAEQS
jgi:hypothetical protein